MTVNNENNEDGLDETSTFLNNVFELHKLSNLRGNTAELMESYSDEVLVKVREDFNEINEEEKKEKQDMLKVIKALTKDLERMEGLMFDRERQIKVLTDQNNHLQNTNSYRKEAEAETNETTRRRLISEVDRKSIQIYKLQEMNTLYKKEWDELEQNFKNVVKQLEENKVKEIRFQEDMSHLRTENQKLKNRWKVGERREE